MGLVRSGHASRRPVVNLMGARSRSRVLLRATRAAAGARAAGATVYTISRERTSAASVSGPERPIAMQGTSRQRAGNGVVPLLFAALLAVDGLHFVFARLLVGVLPPVTSAFFVTAIASVIMLVYAASRGRLRPQTFTRHAGTFLSIGALVATSTTF